MRGLRNACIVALVAVAGCGDDGSTEEEVTKSVREWTAALSEGRGDAACELMLPSAKAEFSTFASAYAKTGPAADCERNVKRFYAKLTGIPRRQIHDADVDDLTIDGDRASVEMADGGPNELLLVKDGDEWRIEHAFRRGWRFVGAPRFGLTPR
jgi:hypothetical protein